MKRPKFYSPELGDEFIKLRDIGPQHAGRIFEARNQKNGEGILGKLTDATHYVLPHEAYGLRFEGETLGMFDVPDALILLKPEGFVMPDTEPEPEQSQGSSEVVE